MNHPQSLISTLTSAPSCWRILKVKLPLSVRAIIDSFANWLADNAKSFYLLPDSVELTLSLCLVIYFASKLVQQA
jgi:hypothetical protein